MYISVGRSWMRSLGFVDSKSSTDLNIVKLLPRFSHVVSNLLSTGTTISANNTAIKWLSHNKSIERVFPVSKVLLFTLFPVIDPRESHQVTKHFNLCLQFSTSSTYVICPHDYSKLVFICLYCWKLTRFWCPGNCVFDTCCLSVSQMIQNVLWYYCHQ